LRLKPRPTVRNGAQLSVIAAVPKMEAPAPVPPTPAGAFHHVRLDRHPMALLAGDTRLERGLGRRFGRRDVTEGFHFYDLVYDLGNRRRAGFDLAVQKLTACGKHRQ
jgi:hypothetical protein